METLYSILQTGLKPIIGGLIMLAIYGIFYGLYYCVRRPIKGVKKIGQGLLMIGEAIGKLSLWLIGVGLTIYIFYWLFSIHWLLGLIVLMVTISALASSKA